METSLAIYEALIQASVPPPAARRVAECLEKDMTSNLATKSDVLLVRQDLEHLEQSMSTRFDALEGRFGAIDARFVSIDKRFDAVDMRFEAIDARFNALDVRFRAIDTHFETLESRFALMAQNLESRIVIKLGALMVVLFSVAGTALKLLG